MPFATSSNGLQALPGWALYEVEFFTGSDCSSGRLVGSVIASGYAPPVEDHAPVNAIDGRLGFGMTTLEAMAPGVEAGINNIPMV